MTGSAKWPGPVSEAGEEKDMFVVTGITGKVGGDVARNLLSKGHKVRAVVRDRAKGDKWAALGCEVSLASIDDAGALTEAFRDAEGVFLMTPPNYDPEPGFPDTKLNAAAIRAAIEKARPAKVVFLSTVGAHVIEPNLLNNSGITEAMLRNVSVPVALLRAAWFMENAAWDVESAKQGVVRSFLQPLAHKIPMVSTKDIAKTVAETLEESWEGIRVVELEGPARYSADDVAGALAGALGTKVRNESVPRASWEELFRSQGMKNPLPRIQMLDGFNEGWIDFEAGEGNTRKGTVTLDSAIRSIISARQG
jgi:NAD(P)H dehydrogenase (quinone)